MSDRVRLARKIAARTKPRFIEIPRGRGGVRVPVTEEQLRAMPRGSDSRGVSVEADPRVAR